MQESPSQGFYAASTPPDPVFPPLRQKTAAKVCVVGGGYTGLSAALHLASAGVETILLEAASVAFAASGRNGGQIHSGFRKEQAHLERWLGEAHARDLWTIAEESKALLRALITEHEIACDLKSGLIAAAHDKHALADLARDAEHLTKRYGFPVRMLDASEIARATGAHLYPGGTVDLTGGHLHPLKFARGLARASANAGARLFEHSRVVALRDEGRCLIAETDAGSVECETAIVACDAFSGNLVPSLARYIGHVESFIIATEPLDDETILPSDAAVADTRHVLDYYRKSADGRLLFAGRESYFTPPKDVMNLVRPRMLRVFPSLAATRIEFGWSGTVGITYTRMPHFGRIGERVLFAHGYSGHGVALSIGGGRALAESAAGKPERFDALARVPARPFPGGAWLRKPMITAGLMWFKLLDAI
jgi:gamma-glutamylputrescine oxidase